MWVLDASSFGGEVKVIFGARIMCPEVSVICPWKLRRRATWDRRSPERWREFGCPGQLREDLADGLDGRGGAGKIFLLT